MTSDDHCMTSSHLCELTFFICKMVIIVTTVRNIPGLIGRDFNSKEGLLLGEHSGLRDRRVSQNQTEKGFLLLGKGWASREKPDP